VRQEGSEIVVIKPFRQQRGVEHRADTAAWRK
jgi:hypothetical protein